MPDMALVYFDHLIWRDIPGHGESWRIPPVFSERDTGTLCKKQTTSLKWDYVFEESCTWGREEKVSRSFRNLSYKTKGSTKCVSKIEQRIAFNSLFALLRSAYLLCFPK